MRAKQVLCFDNSRILGEDFAIQINLSLASAVVCSKVLDLLLIHCSLLFPLLVGVCAWSLMCVVK